MSKLTLIFAGVFTLIAVFAVATDIASPAGYTTTPQINKTKNVRDRSVYLGVGRHRGFRSGK